MQFCFFRRCIYSWLYKALEKWLKMRLWRLTQPRDRKNTFFAFNVFLHFPYCNYFFHPIGTWESPGTIPFGACLPLAASYFVALHISSPLEQTFRTQHMVWTSLPFYCFGCWATFFPGNTLAVLGLNSSLLRVDNSIKVRPESKNTGFGEVWVGGAMFFSAFFCYFLFMIQSQLYFSYLSTLPLPNTSFD